MIALLMVSPGGIALPDLNARLHSSDSTPWTILFALTLVTLLPAILMCMTPLVRLLVVFHFLRQALGTQTAPSNPTLLGLADDDVVFDGPGVRISRPAGSGALSSGRNHGLGCD